MKRKLSVAILTVSLATSVSAPAFAADSTPIANQAATSNHQKTTTSWKHNGVTINVIGDQPLSMQDQIKYEKQTDLQIARYNHTSTNAVSPSFNSPSLTSGVAPRIQIGTGGSYTQINSQNKAFDNTTTLTDLETAVGTIISSICLPASLAFQVGGSVASNEIATWINNYFGVSWIVYTNVSLGMSYSSYWGYYTYVDSCTHFSNSNFTGVLDVTYADTGVRVPDATLASYGLKNP